MAHQASDYIIEKNDDFLAILLFYSQLAFYIKKKRKIITETYSNIKKKTYICK